MKIRLASKVLLTAMVTSITMPTLPQVFQSHTEMLHVSAQEAQTKQEDQASQVLDLLPKEYQPYQAVIGAYRALRNEGHETEVFPVHVAAGTDETMTLVYGLYDINKNGSDEMIVAAETDDRQADYAYKILDIYTLNDEEVIPLTPDVEDIGKTHFLHINEAGKILVTKSDKDGADLVKKFSMSQREDDAYEVPIQADETLKEPLTLSGMADWVPFVEGTSQRIPIAEDDGMAPQNTQDYPYAVPEDAIEEGMAFAKETENAPTKVEVFPRDKTVHIEYGPDNVTVYRADFQSVKTKDIEVFSASKDQEVRPVQVNTQISLLEVLDGQDQQMSEDQWYLFYNNDGGLSLAMPNYAGNVQEGQEDVLVEYLQP